MRYAAAKWNPSPPDCFGRKRTKKSAVCLHHMAGWSGYLRNFDHRAKGVLISAHFTLGADGSLEQHVDTDHIAWTQGIKEPQYRLVQWPGFKGRNPNIDCIGVEMENGNQLWSAHYPMPGAQQRKLAELLRWLGDHVIGERLVINQNLVSHRQINPENKPFDPPVWWWEMQLPKVMEMAYPEKAAPKRTRRLPIPRKRSSVDPLADLTRRFDILERRVNRHLAK